MFTAYLDDSGTAPSQPIAIATALLIPGSQILKLETQWDAFRKKYGFEDFHASECAARNYKTAYGLWSDEKLNKVFFRVRQFCKKFGVQMFSFAVKKTDYDEVIPEILRKNIGSHYTWAVRNTAKHVEEWRARKKIKEPIQYIFDWEEIGSPLRCEIDAAMGQLKDTTGETVHHDFKKRKELPGLQCVDFLAWLSYQLSLDCIQGKDALPIAIEALKDLENYYPNKRDERPDQKWFQVATVRRMELQSWIDNDVPKGEIAGAFDDWNKRHPPKEKPHNVPKRLRKIQRSSTESNSSSSSGDKGKAGRGKTGEKAEEI